MLATLALVIIDGFGMRNGDNFPAAPGGQSWPPSPLDKQVQRRETISGRLHSIAK